MNIWIVQINKKYSSNGIIEKHKNKSNEEKLFKWT